MTIDLTQIQHRTCTVRAADTDTDSGPHLTGIAIPYDTEITLYPGLRESIAPGAVTDYKPQLWWRHHDPIGTYTPRDTPSAWHIDATISDTALGRDARTLARDGAVDALSIGFVPVSWEETKNDDDSISIRHTEIHVVEVSIVPNPAYPTTITEARAERNTMPNPPTTVTPEDITNIRADLADIHRQIATFPTAQDMHRVDHRTAGELIRAALTGDDTATETLSRAYTGAAISDDYGKPTWAADLTEIVEQADPLGALFATGALPSTGMVLEFGAIKDNTVTVAKQVKEGDKLPTGKVSVKTMTAAVETFGGAVEMSVQAMLRSQSPMLDTHLRALAVAAGKQRAASRLAALNSAITAQNSQALTVTGGAAGWKPWVQAFADADELYQALGLTVSGLLLPKATFTALASLEDKNGHPLIQLGGVATNVGDVTTPAFRSGTLLGMPIYSAAVTGPAFFHRDALRHYTAPMVRVTNDLSALNLTSAFGVYEFGAFAVERPAAIIPVTIA